MRSLQLRHSQTPESPQMARAASALDLPLHANLGIMAQRRRRLLRQAHKSAPQTRRVSIRRRGRHQPLRRRDQCRPQTLRVDRTPKPHPRRCQKREGKVRVDPLEGIVAKRMGRPYGPETTWFKILNPTYSQKEGRGELFEKRAG